MNTIKNNAKQRLNTNRIYIIDFFRGAAIIVMVVFHLFFTFGEMFEFKMFEFLYEFFADTILVNAFAGIFIIISGISSSFSKSNLFRGLKTFIIALGISLATYIFPPLFGYEKINIKFGILHFLGIAMMLSPLFLRFAKSVPFKIGVTASFIMLILSQNIKSGFIGLSQNYILFKIPDFLKKSKFLFPLGIINSSFKSADYYPIFPWIFLFIIGIYIGKRLKFKPLPKKMYRSICKPIESIGRHTLYIYIAHQPVFFVIGLLIKHIIDK